MIRIWQCALSLSFGNTCATFLNNSVNGSYGLLLLDAIHTSIRNYNDNDNTLLISPNKDFIQTRTALTRLNMYHSPHGYYHEEYEDLRMMALCMDLSYDESSHIGPHMDPYMDPRTIETRGGGGTPPFLLQIRRAPGSIKSRNQERQVINRELDPPWFTTEARISQARAQPSCREDVWSCRLTPFSGSDCGSRPSAANAQLRHMANCGQAVLEAPCVFAALRAASVYRVVGLLSVQVCHLHFHFQV